MNTVSFTQNKHRCRLCLNMSTEVTSIFREDFAKMIKLLTSIQVEQTDDLPKVACLSCTRKVKAAMVIRKQIIRSHRTLIEETLTKNNKFSIPDHSDTKVQSEDSSHVGRENSMHQINIKKETDIVDPEVILLDIKKENKMEQDEVVSIHSMKSASNMSNVDEMATASKQLNKTNTKNLPVSLNRNEISIVKINKPNYNGVTVSKISDLVNKKSVQIRKGLPKRQLQSSAVIKTNVKQIPIRRNLKTNQPPKKKNRKPMSSCTKPDQLTPAPCKICQKLVLKTNMSRHMQIHDIKIVSCHLCGIVTKNTNLRYHIYYAHKCKEDEYVCDQCGRHFRYRHSFKLHMKKAHDGTKDFECTICGRKFFERRYLTIHIDCHHKKIRPFVCDYCGKDFSTKRILKVHLRQHTESTPYSCDTCGLTFKQNVSLRTHRQQAHDIYEAETVFCEVCGKGFATQVALKSHFILHERKKCVYCSEIFVRDDYLDRHIKYKHGTEFNSGKADESEDVQVKYVTENSDKTLNI